MNRKKTIVIDMDGTICSEEKTFEKSLASPKKNSIKNINKLHKNFFIIIFTARGWAEYNITKEWLERNKIKFDILMCGKPIYDHWIDDRALNFEDWDEILHKIKKLTK